MALQFDDFAARWDTFYDEVMISRIQSLTKDSNHLRVPFNEIQSWDPDFGARILNQPKSLIERGQRSLRDKCRENGINIEPTLLLEHLPVDVEMDLGEIGSDDLNRLRAVNVVITKRSEIRPRIYSAVFSCDSCGAHTEVRQDDERELKEPLECDGCQLPPGNGAQSTRFSIDSDRCTWINNQYLEIQELPERVKGTGQPSRGRVLIEGIQCNMYLPGERMTANLIPYTQAGYHRNKKTPMFEIVYSLHSATRESQPFHDIQPTDEERDEIQEIAGREDLMRLMQDSIAPSIIDVNSKLTFVKRSLAMQLFGGVSRRNADGTRSRGDIHILLMGDPGVAKSQLLTYMSKIAPRARFASGGNISAAGLTAAAIKDSFGDGRFSLEAGILPLSDLGIACIDEIDKISASDKGSLHEAMEQQSISVSKGGITTQLRARCAVLSAANPKKGTFTVGPNQNLMLAFDQTGLPVPLATRFDIMWLMKDEVNEDNDAKIARHIMEGRLSGVPENRVEEDSFEDPMKKDEEKSIKTNGGRDYLSVPFLRKYVAYAKRNHSPLIGEEAKILILNYYTKARNTYADNEQMAANWDDEKPIPISARALESLIRLAEAHARMHLRDEVTADDAQMAIAIFSHWREEEKVPSEVAMATGSKFNQREMVDIIKGTVGELAKEGDGIAHETDVYNRAMARGMDVEDIDRILQLCRHQLHIISPQPGQWRPN